MDQLEDTKARAIETLSALFASSAIDMDRFESAVALLNRAGDGAELSRAVDTLSQVIPAFGNAGSLRPRLNRTTETIDCNSMSLKKNGEWVRSTSYEIRVRAGSLVLDFRDYEFSENFYMDIDLDVSMSSIKLIVPRDFVVLDEFETASMSSVSNRGPPDSTKNGRIVIGGRLSSSSFTVRYK